MEIRQELIVLVVVAAGVGALALRGGGEATSGRTRVSPGSARVERYAAPRVPARSESLDELRSLFSPPRDTRPLDPPSFEEPPIDPLPMLAPPTVYGPGPGSFAELLQRPGVPTGDGDAFEPPIAPEAEPFEPTIAGASGNPNRTSSSPDVLGGASSWSDLDRTEQLEVTAAFQKRYDWMRENEIDIRFGRILNPEPFGLREPERLEEPLRFLVLDPFLGTPRFPEPIVFARERVIDFGLADTPENRIGQTFHDFPDVPTPGTYAAMLDVADECLELRYEFEGALEVAQELYRRCRAYRSDEPAPAVGLARAHLAALEYDQAFEAFVRATEDFPSRAEPWIGLGELQASFLDLDAARASLERAARLEPGSWEAAGALGTFLLERGEYQPALESLRKAVAGIPVEMGRASERVRLRIALGEAQLRIGRWTDARATFAQAQRSLAGDGRAEAGLLGVARLLGEAPPAEALPEPGQAFAGAGGARWLVEHALWLAESEGDLATAREELERAIDLDPLGHAHALRALAWLAWVDGAPEGTTVDATEAALAADPTSPWVLFHRGRVANQRGDLELAEQSLRAALERDASFEDAIAALARLAYERGDHDAAERYLERALALSRARSGADGPGRIDLVTLRGMNALQAGTFREAREHFRLALAADSRSALARGGLAWCELRLGDSEEAVIQLRNLDDARRDEPEDDPLRVWAMRQIERIEENASKDVWTDRFEYSRIGNGWLVDDAAGPALALEAGEVVLGGSFGRTGEVRFYREVSAAEFVALDADLWVGAGSSARIGLLVARETKRASGIEVQSMAALARARDGSTQVRSFDSGQSDEGWLDLDARSFPFPAETWVHVRIERVGEGSEAVLTVLFDGVPVLEGKSASGLSRGNAPLVVGLFAEGETGRTAAARLDDVELTRKIR